MSCEKGVTLTLRGETGEGRGLAIEGVRRSVTFMLKDKSNHCTVLKRGAAHSGKITLRTAIGLESDDTEGREAGEEAIYLSKPVREQKKGSGTRKEEE